ncbi:MAG TPA: type II secretion system protein GspL [Nevskiaceae bacterium]|nr:type II secretion system protein GspL [Nevskiaceae bacterium]
MRETLTLRLRDDALIEYAISVPDASRPGQPERLFQVGQASLESLLEQAVGRRLVLLASIADVRLAEIEVPARQPAKVLQAAPYLLEDHLAEEVDSQHFAIGSRDAASRYPVAVVARSRMDAWLQPFRDRGLRPEALWVDALCLPWADDGTWQGLADGEQILVRHGRQSAFCCHREDLPAYLALIDAEQQRPPLALYVPGDAPADYTVLDWPLELRPGHGSAIEALLASLRPGQGINLLQGAYSPRENLERLWRPWRLAAGLAGAWLLAQGLGYGLDAWRLGREVAALEAANVARYQSLFPEETRIVNLQVQLGQQLARLQGSGADSALFPLLATVAEALQAHRGLTLEGLQFREGALFLSLTGSDLQVLEALRGWFAQQSDRVLEVQSANSGAEGVQIRLKVSRR